MKSNVLLAALILGAVTASTASAATTSKVVKPKSVKIAPLPTLIEGSFFEGAGGQWFQTLPTKEAIYMVGSAEPAGAPTQGEVIAIDPITGSKSWDFLIPGTTDALASTATLDSAGNIWVAGLTSLPVTKPTPQPTPSGVLNPSGIVVPPLNPVRNDLTQIAVWEISSRGTLIGSYQCDAGKVLEPQLIMQVKNTFLISGSNFHLTVDINGLFSKFVQASFVPAKANSIVTFKDGLYIWKSYLSKSPISGVSGWKPTKPGRVILKVGSRTGTIYSAYKVSEPLLQSDFVTGLGLVVTTQSGNGYRISLLK